MSTRHGYIERKYYSCKDKLASHSVAKVWLTKVCVCVNKEGQHCNETNGDLVILRIQCSPCLWKVKAKCSLLSLSLSYVIPTVTKYSM